MRNTLSSRMNPPSEPSKKQGVQQKKSRKPYLMPRRAGGAPTGGPTAGSLSNGAPAGGPAAGSPGNRAPAGSPGAASPSTGAGAPVSGPIGRHPPHAFWPATSPGSSFTVESSPSSSEWSYPPGGFMSYLQMPQTSPPQPYPFVNYPNASYLPENSHFVGAPSCRGTPSPNGSGLAMDATDTQEEESVDIEDDGTLEPARTEKRLNYSHEEDIRLASAWLQNSVDSVDGNDRKLEQYWADVTTMYNNNTPSNRKRNRNQLKIRWDRVKKPVSDFHGCWVRATRVFQSGMSDDQRMEQANEIYASEHGEKPFLLQHIWKVVRHERKWAAYVKKLNKEKENNANPAHVVNVEDSPKKRPMGQKKAKEERNGKRKAPEAFSAIGEKLDKFIEASSKAKNMAEVQQNLADKKLEAAKENHKAAREQTKAKMLDLYRDLLCGSTSGLSEQALVERAKALECMRLDLFAKEN